MYQPFDSATLPFSVEIDNICSFTLPLPDSGSQAIYVGVTHLPYGQIPILLYNGEVTLQTQSGKVATVLLDTHSHVFHEMPQDLGPNQVTTPCGTKASELC